MPDRSHRGLAATPASRGAVTGFLLIVLGIWGAIIPFVGPYFNYAYTPNRTWDLTSARLFLEVFPGAATFLGGVLLVASRDRFTASFGGWLAAASGAWFIVGPLFAPNFRANYLGTPIGGVGSMTVEQIGIFFGLGGAIVLLSAFALGRFSVVGARDARIVEDPRARRDAEVAPENVGVTDRAGRDGAGHEGVEPSPSNRRGSVRTPNE